MKHLLTADAWVNAYDSTTHSYGMHYYIEFTVSSFGPKVKYTIEKVVNTSRNNRIHRSKLNKDELLAIEKAICMTLKWKRETLKNQVDRGIGKSFPTIVRYVK